MGSKIAERGRRWGAGWLKKRSQNIGLRPSFQGAIATRKIKREQVTGLKKSHSIEKPKKRVKRGGGRPGAGQREVSKKKKDTNEMGNKCPSNSGRSTMIALKKKKEEGRKGKAETSKSPFQKGGGGGKPAQK